MRRLLLALPFMPGLALAQEPVGGPGLFLDPEVASASADVAVDASGRLHAAMAAYGPEAADPPPTYATCAGGVAACADPAAWTRVPVGTRAAREVEVAATADGRPRMLISYDSDSMAGGVDHAYAECDAGCGQAAGWTVTVVATSWDNSIGAVTASRTPQRTFALDAEGRPRFVYTDGNYQVEPDHYGAFYMTCKGGCLDRANWVETDLARHASYDTEIFDAPVLRITADGRPRLVARIFGFDEAGQSAEAGVFMLACDEGCGRSGSWSRVRVIDVGSGTYPSPTWDLALDAAGRPRVAAFAGEGMEQADLDHTLIYLWCDAEDCMAEDAWAGNVVVAGHGEAASLALDAEGRPRMAFVTADGGLGVARCDEACEQSGPWAAEAVEGQDRLAAERPTALPFTCDGEVWEGLAPELALTPDGGLVVAYDVSVEGRCLYQDDGDPQVTFDFNQIWAGARVVAPDF